MDAFEIAQSVVRDMRFQSYVTVSSSRWLNSTIYLIVKELSRSSDSSVFSFFWFCSVFVAIN